MALTREEARQRLYGVIDRQVSVKLTCSVPGDLIEAPEDSMPGGVLELKGNLRLVADPAATLEIKSGPLRDYSAMLFEVGGQPVQLGFLPGTIDADAGAMRFVIADDVTLTVRADEGGA
jgi:hypothetical protein